MTEVHAIWFGFFSFFCCCRARGGGGETKWIMGLAPCFLTIEYVVSKLFHRSILFSIIWDNMFFLKQLFYSFSKTI